MTIPNMIPKFKECRVISDVPKHGFVPLFDKFNNHDFGFLSGDNDPEQIKIFVGMWQLCRVWQLASPTITLNKYPSDIMRKYNDTHPSCSDTSVIVEFYALRHAIELAMKAYLNLTNVKYEYKEHKLSVLWEELRPDYEVYHKMKDKTDCFDSVKEFILWFDRLETDSNNNEHHNGENPYRYFLNGHNKLMKDKYINLSRISEYTAYFLSTIEDMAWQYVCNKPEWNKDHIRCTIHP